MQYLLILLMLFASPAWATQDRWPALFDVQGVAPDDVLNIRQAPAANAPIIGWLGEDATGIELIRPNDSMTWALVNTAETSGWVSLSYMSRQPGQWIGTPLTVRQCFGTEPFWSLLFDGDAVTYAIPGSTPVTGHITARLAGTGLLDVKAFLLDFDATDQPDLPQSANAIVSLRACSDGMSGRAYGIRMDAILQTSGGPQLFSGCCSLFQE